MTKKSLRGTFVESTADLTPTPKTVRVETLGRTKTRDCVSPYGKEGYIPALDPLHKNHGFIKESYLSQYSSSPFVVLVPEDPPRTCKNVKHST